jgi:hypothetical protein
MPEEKPKGSLFIGQNDLFNDNFPSATSLLGLYLYVWVIQA